MKHLRILILIPLTLLLTGSVTQQHLMVVARKNVAAGGGGLSWTNLTSGSDTTTEPTSTASITPTANADVFVTVALAVEGGGDSHPADTLVVSGCNLTWTLVGSQPYNRRKIFVIHGTGASPTTGALTLTHTSGNGSTWTESMWDVSEVTGAAATPYTNFVTATGASGTSATVTVTGTVDSGDHVFFAVAHETNETVTLEASLTQLSATVGGTDVRTVSAGYDGTPTIDQTPSATWSTSSSWACAGMIIEVAP